MADLWHQWGGDIALTPAGDLALATGATLSQQRVLRRLLTAPGEYLWHLDYGAGLPDLIGTVTEPATIQALALTQLQLEETVAADPPPSVTVQAITGGYALSVSYTTANTGEPQTLSFNITE